MVIILAPKNLSAINFKSDYKDTLNCKQTKQII